MASRNVLLGSGKVEEEQEQNPAPSLLDLHNELDKQDQQTANLEESALAGNGLNQS